MRTSFPRVVSGHVVHGPVLAKDQWFLCRMIEKSKLGGYGFNVNDITIKAM